MPPRLLRLRIEKEDVGEDREQILQQMAVGSRLQVNNKTVVITRSGNLADGGVYINYEPTDKQNKSRRQRNRRINK